MSDIKTNILFKNARKSAQRLGASQGNEVVSRFAKAKSDLRAVIPFLESKVVKYETEAAETRQLMAERGLEKSEMLNSELRAIAYAEKMIEIIESAETPRDIEMASLKLVK